MVRFLTRLRGGTDFSFEALEKRDRGGDDVNSYFFLSFFLNQ